MNSLYKTLGDTISVSLCIVPEDVIRIFFLFMIKNLLMALSPVLRPISIRSNNISSLSGLKFKCPYFNFDGIFHDNLLYSTVATSSMKVYGGPEGSFTPQLRDSES